MHIRDGNREVREKAKGEACHGSNSSGRGNDVAAHILEELAA